MLCCKKIWWGWIVFDNLTFRINIKKHSSKIAFIKYQFLFTDFDKPCGFCESFSRGKTKALGQAGCGQKCFSRYHFCCDGIQGFFGFWQWFQRFLFDSEKVRRISRNVEANSRCFGTFFHSSNGLITCWRYHFGKSSKLGSDEFVFCQQVSEINIKK